MEISDKHPHPFRIVNTTVDMAEQLAALQRACFPTIGDDHLIRAEHYRAHIAIFPEGQHAVIDQNGKVVASSSDFRTHVDFNHIEHSHLEATGDNWLTTHIPDGEWLYGFDISVHPEYRGLRLSHLIYNARRRLAKRLNLKGHVAGGILKGYPKYKDRMDARTYVQKVAEGEIFDPVVSVQLRRGFKIIGVIDHYIDDSSCDNKAAFIVWHNLDYKSPRPEKTEPAAEPGQQNG